MFGVKNLSKIITNSVRGIKFSSPVFDAKVCQKAPFFEGTAVVNNEFKTISSKDYEGKYLVLFFYPLDFTFVCPTELTSFSDHMPEFEKLSCNVVGVSADSHFSHHAWINTPRKQGGLGGLNYPLLSDFNKNISKDFGVLHEGGMPLRGLYIMNPKGIVRHITINDLPVGRSVQEVLRLVKAFKYSDEHGEVCPAGWSNEKDATIKPDLVNSKDYFKNVD